MLDEVVWPKKIPFELTSSNLIMCGRRGSESHGLFTPSTDPDCIDDRDLIAVVLAPDRYYIGLLTDRWEGVQEINGVWDVVVFELRKYLYLVCQQNPNALLSLWLNQEDYLYTNYAWEMIYGHRHAIRAREPAYLAFRGFGRRQGYDTMGSGAYRGYMGAKRKELVKRYGFDCYEAATTEFLTDRGWRFFDDVGSDDLLATVDAQTGRLDFQRALDRVDQPYTGELFVLEPQSSRAVVTRNHKLLVSPMRRGPQTGYSCAYDQATAAWQLLSPAEILAGRRSYFHTRRAPEARLSGVEVPESYLTLAGLFLSDGSLGHRGGAVKDVRLYQTKTGRYRDLADQMMSIYPFRRFTYGAETIWSAHGDIAGQISRDFGHADEKHLPDWCYRLSTAQAEVLWTALVAGDGTVKEDEEVLYTSSARLAGDVQAAMVSAGSPCTVLGPYASTTQYGDVAMYHVVRSWHARRVQALSFSNPLHESLEPKPGYSYPVRVRDVRDDRVVCFDVPNGTLVTRNKGKVAIHGNCKAAMHWVRVLRMGAEYVRTGEMQVRRTHDRDELLAIKQGRLELDEVRKLAHAALDDLEKANKESALPETLDMDLVRSMAQAILRVHVSH